MAEKIKYMDIKEFREGGYLQEVNRRFFHPLGLALEVTVGEDGHPASLVGIWDCRDDPEGMSYGPGIINEEKRIKISQELQDKYGARKQALGYMIQYE